MSCARPGFRQLETAVRLLQSVVDSIKPGEQAKLIRDLSASGLKRRGPDGLRHA